MTISNNTPFTEEELKALKHSDAEVDKIPLSDIDKDLTADQAGVAKKMRQSSRKIFNLDGSKREKKQNPDKIELIECLRESLGAFGADRIETPNQEREIEFMYNSVKYKLILSIPRK